MKESAKNNPNCDVYEQPLEQTLAYFNCQKEFQEAWNSKLFDEQQKKKRQNKWNGQHILKIFNVDSKELNPLKKLF